MPIQSLHRIHIATRLLIVYTSDLCVKGETVASKLEGNVARVQVVGETLALGDGRVVEGKEVHGLAGAVLVVPDNDTLAEQGVLSVKVGLEGVVVNAPVTVQGGLVASEWSDSNISAELGFTQGRVANVTLLPGLELDAGDRNGSVGGHRECGHGGEGLSEVHLD